MRYRLEALHRVLLNVVPDQVGLGVVDSKTALSTGVTIKIARVNGDNRHSVVGAVRWVLEVQRRGPVV